MRSPSSGTAFEAANPGTTVEFNFASSSSLVTSITEGAPADVFASANESNMTEDRRCRRGRREPQVFVTNLLQIAVPAGNPAGVTGLDDFAREDLLIGLCAEEVPCGEFGREVLANAGVTPSIDTNEPDVRALLTKCRGGRARRRHRVRHRRRSRPRTPSRGSTSRTSPTSTATYPIVRLDAVVEPRRGRCLRRLRPLRRRPGHPGRVRLPRSVTAPRLTAAQAVACRSADPPGGDRRRSSSSSRSSDCCGGRRGPT